MEETQSQLSIPCPRPIQPDHSTSSAEELFSTLFTPKYITSGGGAEEGLAGKPDETDEGVNTLCEYRSNKTHLLSANNQDKMTLMKLFSRSLSQIIL